MTALNIVFARLSGGSHVDAPNGPAGSAGVAAESAKSRQQMGFPHDASEPTTYCVSICTSERCTTWKGVLPVEVKVFGFDGAAEGNGTV